MYWQRGRVGSSRRVSISGRSELCAGRYSIIRFGCGNGKFDLGAAAHAVKSDPASTEGHGFDTGSTVFRA